MSDDRLFWQWFGESLEGYTDLSFEEWKLTQEKDND